MDRKLDDIKKDNRYTADAEKSSEKFKAEQENKSQMQEHILVCLSASPSNPKIIRTAARMANAFRGSFTAIYVETQDFTAMSEENKQRLHSNIALAQKLGATVETAYGEDEAFQIAEFSRLSGVTKIVLGRNNTRRKYVFGRQALTERLTEAAPNLDIYIIPDYEAQVYKERKSRQTKFQFLFSDVLKSIVLLVMATMIGHGFFYLGFSEANIITVYILSVLITAIITSQRAYSLISSVISVLTFNFFFTDPRYTLNAYDSGYPVTFLIMFISAFLTGTLAVKIKQNAKQSAQTAYRTKVLLETNQLLQKAKDENDIISLTANQLTKLLLKDIIFYSIENKRLAEPSIFWAAGETANNYMSESEKRVAEWAFKNNKHAGATTNVFRAAKCLYLAVRVNESVYGVVGIAMNHEPLDSFENSIVLSILGECALAMENQRVSNEREEAAVLAKNEQLRANLLRSISHDLRTPLTSISGNAGILLSNEDSIEKEKRKALYADIYDDSLWLINLVENLLSVTRIEDGTMNLNLTAELMEEIISEALGHINRKSIEHKITVKQAEEFILAKVDARLIVQVIINIVDNAIKYTQKDSEIVINTSKNNDKVVVEIADNGAGITDDAKSKIFDMFFTTNTKIADSRRSLGLGLALCKSIITAHGGTISVRDNVPHGTIFEFSLQAEEVTLHE